jgi:hypothetical protein
MEAGPCLVAISETGPERSSLVGAHDTQIAKRELLQVLISLAEVQVEQEFERPDVIQRDELCRPTMLRGNRERNSC